MAKKSKKTLYKIPTEAEIAASKMPEVDNEEILVPELPVVEPEPVAVLDTAKDKEEKSAALEIARKRAGVRLSKQLERESASVPVIGHYAGEPVDDFASISIGDARILKSNEQARIKHEQEQKANKPEEFKPEPVAEEVYDHKTARLIFGSETDFTQLEGISVGGRNVVHAKNTRRLTREKRREKIEERKSMKVMVAGEEQELSEASKYMLDMLIKNPNKE